MAFKLLHKFYLAAEFKNIEVLKTINIPNKPIVLERNNTSRTDKGKSVKPGATREWNEDGHTKTTKESCSRNAAKSQPQ